MFTYETVIGIFEQADDTTNDTTFDFVRDRSQAVLRYSTDH